MNDTLQPATASCSAPRADSVRTVVWLQLVTLAWMLVECGVSIYAAARAHSPALLAFGSDSLVELLSTGVVLLQFSPAFRLSERRAARLASVLLYALAVVVGGLALVALIRRAEPQSSRLGMAITFAALVAMPVLAWLKRREARRLGNAALAADAVQSATCAWLALITLVGLAANVAFNVAWLDPVAALAAVPFLVKEARSAWRGQTCACH